MSEAKTLWEVFENEVAGLTEVWRKTNPELVLKDGSLIPSGYAEAALAFIESIPDALINPGFIVTADRVEAAAKAIYEDEARRNNWVRPWEKKDGRGEQAVWLRIATAAITAAGGIVPDEVVEVGAGWGAVVIGDEGLELAHEDYTNELSVAVHSGDRIYIVRADTSTASTRSADTSKDRRGIDRGK